MYNAPDVIDSMDLYEFQEFNPEDINGQWFVSFWGSHPTEQAHVFKDLKTAAVEYIHLLQVEPETDDKGVTIYLFPFNKAGREHLLQRKITPVFK